MKKIGIFTLNGNVNYGNRLQNYAVQKYLEDLGYNVDTIMYQPRYSVSQKTLWQKLCKHILNVDLHKIVIEKLDKIVNKNKYQRENDIREKRIKTFECFSEKYIHETSYVLNQEVFSDSLKIKNFDKEYFTFFVGSDQVWNLDGIHFPSFYFLPFIQKIKRNSLAASFGVENVDDSFEDEYKSGISGMNRISVREESGANIVKKLTSKESTLLLDPVFLLDKSEWIDMGNFPKVIGTKKYLLTYFLGKRTVEYTKIIDDFAVQQDLSIIHLNDFSYPEYFNVSPDQFLSLISEATFFFTDSFHGVAFSIILNKPFMVLDRVDKVKSMSTRIEMILKRFELTKRYYAGGKKVISSEWIHLNYANSNKVIEKNRNQTNIFLGKCFADVKSN